MPEARADAARDRSVAYVLIATLLFSFVGPVAKLVPHGAGLISFYRAAFATAALGAVLALGRRPRRQELAALFAGDGAGGRARAASTHLALGLLISGNWYFYVRAVQVSSVAIAVVCLFTYPLLTALLEPLFFGEPYRVWDLLSGALVLIGVVTIVERFSLSEASALGAVYGLFASASLTLRNLLSRRAVRTQSPELVGLIQFAIAACVFFPFVLGEAQLPAPRDLLLLALIGGGLTMVSQVLFIAALRQLSTSLASLIVSLQPILATLIALALLGEVPGPRTLLGGALVLGAVVLALAMNPRRRALPVARG